MLTLGYAQANRNLPNRMAEHVGLSIGLSRSISAARYNDVAMGKAHAFDPFRELTTHAQHLNSITQARPDAAPFYEMMSGALVWPDETTDETPTTVIWALRPVWAYRTGAMFDEPRDDCLAIWSHARSCFPTWVGFRPERSVATDSLARIYRDGRVRLRACLRDLSRVDERDAK
jgi:hypothetical protein